MLIRPESKSSGALSAAVKISLFCMTLLCIQAPVQAQIPGFGAVEAPKEESSAEAAEETAPEAIAIADY
jgi:hypothetical protein